MKIGISDKLKLMKIKLYFQYYCMSKWFCVM